MDTEQVLQEGIALHNAGRLGDAARCYQRVLAADPANPDALNLMSALTLVAGEAETARELAARARAAQPDWFAPYVSLGNALQALGRPADAVECFRAAITLNPRSAEAYCNLSSALGELGRHDEAIGAAVEAIVIDGSLVQAHLNFGHALMAAGQPGDAVEAFRKAVALAPDFGDAWYDLGCAHAALDEDEEAVASLRRSNELEPAAPKFYNLGNVHLRAGRFAEAEAAFAQARALAPDSIDVRLNLATAIGQQGRIAESEAEIRAVVAQHPDCVDARFNLSLLLLRQGKYAEGWREYEWRWGLPKFQPLKRDLGKPAWDGQPLPGKTLLLTVEQGFGDALQHARLATRAAALCGRVVVECRPGLERLLATLPGVAQVVPAGSPLPEFDAHAPMLSLARLLGLTLDDLPGPVPYLAVPQGAADFTDVAAMPGRKVGLVWAGSATRDADTRRSLRPAMLKPLLDIPDACFFSLQVGGAAPDPAMAGRVRDLAPRLGDFADTAAAIAALDLVVTVDTAVAHLAGALGKPVWVMLSTPCDGFLWMDGRADSPWYPTARLFRQPVPGDWAGMVTEVAAALAGFTRG